MRINVFITFITASLIGYSMVLSELIELKSYPLNSMDGVITELGVEFDSSVSTDGKGSLKIKVDDPTVIRLFETGDLDIENAKLIYKADLKTKDITGNVYLEMWCYFEDQGEYFSRALHNPFTGTADWKSQQAPFFLKEGQNPDNVKLNLIVDGQGTVWIDNIILLKTPLH